EPVTEQISSDDYSDDDNSDNDLVTNDSDKNFYFREIETNFLSDSEVNKKYCKKETNCRFLFMYYHSGQESKANIHLKTLSYIAGILDRTMVLTNVGRSRIESGNLKVGLEIDLKKPSIQHLHFSHGDSLIPLLEHVDPIIEPVTHVSCFNKFDIKFDDSTIFQRILINSEFLSQVNDGNDSSTLLIKNLMDSDAEVLLIKDDIGKEILTQTHSAIPYANHIIQEALRVKVALKSYVAVYWDFVGVDPENLPKCAEQLKDTLQYIQEIHGIHNVYLSTNYPMSIESNDSSSQLTKYYNQAMTVLNSTTNVNISSWVTFDAFGKLRDKVDNDDEFRATDGVQQILDRIVCIDADYFLNGPSKCCEQLNAFTKTVFNARSELYKSNPSIQNIISRW
ncbi:30885_t:CDS:2, partial [Racocetra persica]